MMHRLIRILPVLWAGCATAFAIETSDFSRYQPVIDRTPFGAVQGSSTEQGPKWTERWQYVGNTVSNAGNGPLQAILYDKEANRSYFRAEGESLDANVSIVTIDVVQRPPKVILKNGLETATISFPDRGSVAMAPTTPVMVNPTQPAQGTTPPTIRRIPFRRGN